MLRRLAARGALVLTAALVLVGCTPPEPSETTPPPSTSGPDPEQSESKARSAWDAYQDRLAELGAAPATANLDSLLEVAGPEHAEFLLANFRAAADARVHAEGERVTTAFELTDASSAPATLTVAVCVDLTDDRLVGDEGEDLTPANRELHRGYTVTFIEDADVSRYRVADAQDFDGPESDHPCR